MKTFLIALPLLLVGTSAFATTGTINFSGQINGSTCSVEVVNPDSGAVGNLVQMGAPLVSDFPAIGSEAGGRSFALRVKGECGLSADDPNYATVKFGGIQGGAGADQSLFGIKPGAGTARGVAVAIRDRTGTQVRNGEDSAQYPLNATGASDLFFTAVYQSTAAVTAGSADADVAFIVSVN
ncbi:fimbrial protein [Pseudomonas sp. zfem002]|uniref:fimbrial protein n=1 Tax=Pseudomonas sp. zfem002 TaxID=3078197 RepID=UPI002927AB3F|nr:fimbrial protein [Pseudomonas sp. zfem002]MDU9389385.1 fimbrial protein [Pseudomonas sp. zfem002]